MLEIRTRIGKLFDQIAFRKTEQAVDLYRPRRELMEALRSEREIDVDEFEIILQQSGKTRQDFESDLAIYAKRVESVGQLAMYEQARADCDRLNAELKKLNAEHAKFLERWQPKVNAVYEQRQAAESQLGIGLHAERYLQATVLDPSVLAKQADLDARRMELAGELREVNERAMDGEQRLRYAQSIVDGLESRAEKIKAQTEVDYEKGHTSRELLKARTSLKQMQSTYEPVFQRRDELRAAMRALDAEQRMLTERKLVP